MPQGKHHWISVIRKLKPILRECPETVTETAFGDFGAKKIGP